MIIYLEKKYKDNKIASDIIGLYKNAKILEIDNYKNIFDKNISGKTEKSIILAGINNSISDSPYRYGHQGKGYFFKTSLNCVYDCSYCYLKGLFKNDNVVIFVNYLDIKNQILETISNFRKNNKKDTIWFYSSDYCDNLAVDNITKFSKNFIPFFSKLDNVKMEIRTKSCNITNLLKLDITNNVEIAFSLNPSEIIEKYENKTSSLDARLDSINKLIVKGWQVGIRFIPLLEVENYKDIYKKFLEYIIEKIDFSKVYSVFIGGLLYTKDDYNKMLKKEPYLDLLYKLENSKDGFVREKKEVREFFYNLFDELIKNNKCNRCLDE